MSTWRPLSPSLRYDAICLTDYLTDPRLRVECAPGFGQIYKIAPTYKSSSNGYVGQNRTSLFHRLTSHLTKNSKCTAICNAIQRRGVENFTIEILQADIPISELNAQEVEWIAEMDTWRHGYNCTPGGDSNPMDDPDVRARHKSIVSDPAFIKKCVQKRKITFATEEFKMKVSVSHKIAWSNPESKKKMSASQKKAWSVEGAKAARGSTMRKVWSDPKQHAATVKARKLAQKRPEVKSRKSEIMKERWRKWKAGEGEKPGSKSH